jgi:hypothetical protein
MDVDRDGYGRQKTDTGKMLQGVRQSQNVAEVMELGGFGEKRMMQQ